MKKKLISCNFVYFKAFFLLAIQPIHAEEISTFTSAQIRQTNLNTANLIPRLKEIELPKTNLHNWLTQQTPTQEITEITKVNLKQTETGLEIILETSTGTKLVPLIFSEGNKLVIDILDATLALSTGNQFRKTNPTPGIKKVSIINIDKNQIRIAVTGEKQVPSAEVIPSNQNLVLSINPKENTAQTQPDEEIKVEVIATREPENDDYLVPNATTGTKLELSQRDIPQSIQVIPRQVIENRQVTRLNELTDNVSGVQRVPGYGGVSSVGARIRGFTTQFETLRNGFRDFGYLSPRDPANVERVEILKGPSSVLYGGGVVGFSGQINTVTKKPQAKPRYEIGMVAGSYDFYRPTLDFTGTLNSDRSLLYRLNVAYENSGSFRDFGASESYLVAPVLTWKIGKKTNFTLELEQQGQDYFFDNGFPAEAEFLDLPSDRFLLGEPDLNDAEWDSTSITYTFEHEFSKNWKFRQGFNATIVDGNTASSFFEPLEDDRRTLPRIFFRSQESQENYSLQNELFVKFNTGSVKHNLLFGVELARYEFDFTFFEAEIDPIDILNPVYGARPSNFLPGDRRTFGVQVQTDF